MENQNQEEEIRRLIIIFLAIAISLIILSIIAPLIFTQYSIVDFTDTGEIGDTLGGIMNPFIAMAGVAVTFLAFYMQYKANHYQRDQFNIQLNKEKEQFRQELDLQKDQFHKNRFENQFYEMLKLHNQNVNNIEITQKNYESDEKYTVTTIRGIKALVYLLTEFEIAYELVKKELSDKTDKSLINIAYSYFFRGIENYYDYPIFREYLKRINSDHRRKYYWNLDLLLEMRLGPPYNFLVTPKYDMFLGHSNQLAHYYRQLFQIVKFVANQDESFITYEEKRRYLRILRAELSNQEQMLLFYNWLSGYGSQWEDERNKFFTDYRMIHNIERDALVDDFQFHEIFDLQIGYRTEKNRQKDPLFEFQDWE
ncbi:putative phage abortive infection protein [bacterium SCSIO 12643]|nr:putative phage abortive infection protein [bacterium SCSIO 12643]